MNILSWLSVLDYGDVPTWVGSISAIVALIFFALSYRTQSEQIKIQEKQIVAQDKRLTDELLNKHANSFGFWLEPQLINPKIHFINESVIPLRSVVIFCQKSADGKLVNIYGSDEQTIGFRSIPKGDKFVHSLPEGVFDLSKRVAIYFTDNAGVVWRKDSEGKQESYEGDLIYPTRWLDIPQEISV